ncbi:MAG: UDP-N-acetylmuramoyl-L-alanine--D-glutamate ligase, partial [Anaerolineae bacterium]|nr:UDP-N-acetylmuramoyl-L-alanine--D-glutamate ligase [Anaerolineae bacterium]
MDWKDERVVIVGVARQGTALAQYLAGLGARVVLTDRRSAADLGSPRAALAGLPIDWELGGHPLSLLDGADWLCPSGGVPLTIPLVVAAQERGIPLTNDSQVFIAAAPCPVVGITGSAGKTTTTTLVGRMAAAAVQHGS